MGRIFQGRVKIENTRTGGQDPNWLGINFSPAGVAEPVLQVKGTGLAHWQWDVVPTMPDFPDVSPSFVQMTLNDVTFRLGVDFPPRSSAQCVLNQVGKTPVGTVFDQWYFPYDTRILIAYDLINPARKQFSLDTGLYPKVAIWDFHSSVNQTWRITPL